MGILQGSGPLGSGPTGPGSGFSVMPLNPCGLCEIASRVLLWLCYWVIIRRL